MENILWALGGAIYALIGFRAAVVAWATEKRIGRRDKAWTFWCFVLWPVGVVVVGLVVTLTGDCGIYDSAYRHAEKDAPTAKPSN